MPICPAPESLHTVRTVLCVCIARTVIFSLQRPITSTKAHSSSGIHLLPFFLFLFTPQAAPSRCVGETIDPKIWNKSQPNLEQILTDARTIQLNPRTIDPHAREQSIPSAGTNRSPSWNNRSPVREAEVEAAREGQELVQQAWPVAEVAVSWSAGAERWLKPAPLKRPCHAVCTHYRAVSLRSPSFSTLSIKSNVLTSL